MKQITGEVEHIKDNFIEEDCHHYMKVLRKEVPWQRAKWGRGYLPRLIFRCDEEIKELWPESIKELKQRTEETFQCTVKAGWCNLYQSGDDYTPPHQDNYGSHVITWSFGESRRFVTQEIETGEKNEYILEDGDIFYFSPLFDMRHKHSVPKSKRKLGARISIVFFTDQPYCGSHWRDQIDRPLFRGLPDEFEIVFSDDLTREEIMAILSQFALK